MHALHEGEAKLLSLRQFLSADGEFRSVPLVQTPVP
jgi:hypothetical protein